LRHADNELVRSHYVK